ncbi:MAG: helix-turn-helix transcriptional regulator [Bacteroidota bacterium]|nr:helix-turn-helix transcriptional regulator [Bacteroidota bacterium]
MGHAGRHIPNRLRKYRRIMGYTQSEVAFILDVHDRNRIARWEQGICMPSAKNLLQLSILYSTLAKELYSDYLKDIKGDLGVNMKVVMDKRARGKK